MSNSSSPYSSCLGCLTSLIFLSLVGSLLVGLVKCSVTVGNFTIGAVSTSQTKQPDKIENSSNLEEQKKTIEKAIEKFHAQINQGKCKEIYTQAHQKLKEVTSQSELISFCEKINRQLGSVKSVQPVGWWKSAEPSTDQDKYILVHYYTNFSNVPARETFIWLVEAEKTELVSYQIDPVGSKQNTSI